MKSHFPSTLLILAIFSLFFVSCEDKEDKQAEIDRQKILDYIAENNIEAQETASGLFYVIDNPGTGEHPTPYSTVVVRYTGYFLDGFVFDTNEGGQASTLNLQSVIRGWREGIPLFRTGGSGKLLVPSRLAYGANSLHYYGIPNNSVLIFDIRLIEFY
jgi:FKBP-type peptidyl-prolyl cis-trans isomerase FkpA